MNISPMEHASLEAALCLGLYFFPNPKISDIYVIMAQLDECWSNFPDLDSLEGEWLRIFYRNRDRTLARYSRFKQRLSIYFNLPRHNRLFLLEENAVKPIDPSSTYQLISTIDPPIENCIRKLEKKARRVWKINEIKKQKEIIKLSAKGDLTFDIPPKDLEKLPKKSFPKTKEKQLDQISLNFHELAKLALDLDNLEQWKEKSRVAIIENLSNLSATLNENKNNIDLTAGSVNLIIAPTGSGKSLLMELFSLIASDDNTIILVVETIEKLLTLYTNLKRSASLLNLKREISCFIGDSNRYEHLGRILESYDGNTEISVVQSAFEQLSYVCLLSAYESRQLMTSRGKEPCFRLKHDQTLKACPFLHTCSKFDIYKKLATADIIITTQAGILQGRIPIPFVSPEKKLIRYSMLEFSLRFGSLIFIDEIETFQQKVTGALTKEIDLDKTFQLLREIDHFRRSGFIPRSARIAEVTQPLYALQPIIELTEDWLHQGDLRWPNHTGVRFKISHITIEDLQSYCINDWNRLMNFEDENKSVNLFFTTFRISFANDGLLFPPSEDPPEFRKIQRIVERLSRSDLSISNLRSYQKELHQALKKARDQGKNTQKLIARLTENIILMIRLKVLQNHFFHAWSGLARLNELDVEFSSTQLELITHKELLQFCPYGCLGRSLISFAYERGERNQPGKLHVSFLSGTPQRLVEELGGSYSFYLTGYKKIITGLSATAFFPVATQSHVFGRNIVLIPDLASSRNIRFEDIPLRDEETEEYIKISGISGTNRRVVTHALTKTLIPELESQLKNLQRVEEDRARILLVTNSYNESKWVAEALKQASTKFTFKVILRQTNFDESLRENWLPKSKIEQFASTGADILISPLKVISREHNILNPEGRSAIGTIMMLVRPIPPINNARAYLSYLGYNHLNRTKNLSDYSSVLPGEAFINCLRQIHRDRHSYERSMVPFSRIPFKSIQMGIVADILVELVQLIGRGRRGKLNEHGGSPIRLFFIDGAFVSKLSWKKLIGELILLWKSTQDWDQLIFLYKPIIQALSEYSGVLSEERGDYTND